MAAFALHESEDLILATTLRASAPSATAHCDKRTVVHRRFVRCGCDVAVENARVRVVENRGLDPPLEQRLRLAHEVLVESILRRDAALGDKLAAIAMRLQLNPRLRTCAIWISRLFGSDGRA